jgi:CheY-like chemotaxis protein
MVMPDGLTGGELADQLRAQKPQLKVIFSSGYNVDLSRTNFVSRNDGFSLPKPYEPQRLAQIVRECLDTTSSKFRRAT